MPPLTVEYLKHATGEFDEAPSLCSQFRGSHIFAMKASVEHRSPAGKRIPGHSPQPLLSSICPIARISDALCTPLHLC